jgi:hypothetical protein
VPDVRLLETATALREIAYLEDEDAVEYLTITYEGGGLCVASSVRMEGSNE